MDNLIIFTIKFISILLELITYAIIARILLSWFSMGQRGRPGGKIAMFIHNVTEPVLSFFKKFPHKIGMFDLSPIIAIFVLDFLAGIMIDLLYKLL